MDEIDLVANVLVDHPSEDEVVDGIYT